MMKAKNKPRLAEGPEKRQKKKKPVNQIYLARIAGKQVTREAQHQVERFTTKVGKTDVAESAKQSDTFIKFKDGTSLPAGVGSRQTLGGKRSTGFSRSTGRFTNQDFQTNRGNQGRGLPVSGLSFKTVNSLNALPKLRSSGHRINTNPAKIAQAEQVAQEIVSASIEVIDLARNTNPQGQPLQPAVSVKQIFIKNMDDEEEEEKKKDEAGEDFFKLKS